MLYSFLRDEDGGLTLGIRRAGRSVLYSHILHHIVLSLAANVVSTKNMFHIFYNPRASSTDKRMNLVVNLQMCGTGKPLEFLQTYVVYSTSVAAGNSDLTMANCVNELCLSPKSLGKSLACLPYESPTLAKRSQTRVELKRLIETRIKKRVKEQYLNNRFHDLMAKVIANPRTLEDAYNCIRLNSNIQPALDHDLPCFFESMAEELLSEDFDVKANTFTISSKTGKKEALVLPNLKLKIIQEAIRIVLEVVYRPHFSKISHGCRSGRGHRSALSYICREIRNPDWFFTLCLNKKPDVNVFSQLILAMEERIDDDNLFSVLRHMFDAQVLNLEFGGFPKGQGLPQEGVLSSILMNIYLDLFDHELYKICLKYEGFGLNFEAVQVGESSRLRRWMRRQLKDGDNVKEEDQVLRLHSCRFMDEIFIALSGSKDFAMGLKVEILDYLKKSLYLDVDGEPEILPYDNTFKIQFLGMVIQPKGRESSGQLRAVHKLKDKVELFALQKQEHWDAMNVRIGKKWLAYCLKKLKESESKEGERKNKILSQLTQFRKTGMKTDHWFKFLLKIWMQDLAVESKDNEEHVLCKYIAEPALPQELLDSFYKFQWSAQNYISSEASSTLCLLSSTSSNTSNETGPNPLRSAAPISVMMKSLLRYGLINSEGYPRRVSSLVLQDDLQIMDWFSGLVLRWQKWFGEYVNFREIRQIMSEYVRKSCIRTLASKHRMPEAEVERRFESELSLIPSNEEMESLGFQFEEDDEAILYGISHSGLCLLSLARVKNPSPSCVCFVLGCSATRPSIYTLHVKEKRKFPGWKTGFSTAIFPGLHKKKIGLCKQHVKDLYLGYISLQALDFGASSR